MVAAFEKLYKILLHEKSQGCRNQVVYGGLQALAPHWRSEALATVPGDSLVSTIEAIAADLEAYAGADPSAREGMLSRLLPVLAQGSADGSSERPTMTGSAVSSPVRPSANPPPVSPILRPWPAVPAGPAHRPASGLDAPVSTLPGIKGAYAQKLERLGIATVGDLLHHYPHRYDDYTSLKVISHLLYGEDTTIVGTVAACTSRDTKGGRSMMRCTIYDESGSIEAVWFNQPYLVRQMRTGRKIVFSGRVTEFQGRLTLQSPAWEPLEAELIHTARLVPIYPLTSGIGARWLRRLIKQVVDHWAPRLEDHLPSAVRARQDLMDLSTAIRQIHFPDAMQSAQQARRRLSFDEFLLIQLGLLNQRQRWQIQQATPIPIDEELLDDFVHSLPFRLTSAQQRSLAEILHDLALSQPMSRLLQGDVGSGKTVIAAAAMLLTLAAGQQSALMAPTEILAQQHHATVDDLLGGRDWGLGRHPSVVLLTGSLSRVEKVQAYQMISSGQADIVVGTHALIQQSVEFKDLGLVVVDEQHRFGVAQRGTLRGKGQSSHVLVMSATPIPRSLALTVYGDLDVSVIDELPPGRQHIETRWLLPGQREQAYAFVRSQVAKGRQAFFLYPLIEESDKLEIRAAVEEFQRLQQTVFSDLRLGLLHGRMKSKEKEAVMGSFRQGALHILVSTSVIEVGIDVPNATVMLIEGADRFGLAQLHQFRGRVGRGAHRSYCLLLSDTASPNDPQTRTTWERLKAIEDTQDGFVLAERDLELRGPGDFFGVRQSGLPALRLASLSNLKILEQAREEARTIFQQDPKLCLPEHRLLERQLAQFWKAQGDLS
jgi:ATP-dependent DNA helicase RecG